MQSRTHHETGLRHKGNYERYIRDIYKKGITEKKDKRDEAREIERIEAVRPLPYFPLFHQCLPLPLLNSYHIPTAPYTDAYP